jgi:fatty acid desaturase (delta-4 desaturase)
MPPQTGTANSPKAAETSKELTLAPDCIQVDDKIYSAAALAKDHPGGELFVRAFGGRDATEAFMSYHRKEFPHSKLESMVIGGAPQKKKKGADADFMELCALVEKVVPKHKAFAPWHYYLKVAVILGGALSLEGYMHYTGNYKWYLSAVLGWFLALIGLNVQHDANHGAVSKNWVVNRFLGSFQNWLGGSAVDWIHQHVVQHHIFTNDLHHDCDIHGGAVIRLNPLKPLLKHQFAQGIYVFILIGVFGFTTIWASLVQVLEAKHYTPYSKMLKSYLNAEVFTSCLWVLRWFIIPFYHNFSFNTFLQIAPMYVVGGYYLAFFFILSHNFVGVHMFDESAAKHTESFLYKQVASSSNVGGAVLAVFNGGLNFQIEHHLFPRMSHTHYATIAPIVREYCAKKNIPYIHFPTVWENFMSTVSHLTTMGSVVDPGIPTNKGK